jgi:hypothetical protein
MMSIDIALSAMQAAMKPTNSPKDIGGRDLEGMISSTEMEKRKLQRCRQGKRQNHTLYASIWSFANECHAKATKILLITAKI